jgi:SOS response regulatory protein OraA/RecX
MIQLKNLFRTEPKFKDATEEVIHILNTRGYIDQRECNEKNITTRLSGMIHRLRNQLKPMNIISKDKTIITRYGKKTDITVYYLEK